MVDMRATSTHSAFPLINLPVSLRVSVPLW